ncbi:MAG: hypothetical protein AB8B50_08845 [Pirellulaceae bacterium]
MKPATLDAYENKARTLEFSAAQKDIRFSFLNGGPGALVSAAVWLAAALVTAYAGVELGFPVLFFGGMFIFPLGALITRTILKRPGPLTGNPGSRIAFETVPPMIVTLFVAYLFVRNQPEYVFPISAMAVGSHYCGFRSAYGLPSYWVIAAIMTGLGFLSLSAFQLPENWMLPALIAAVEAVFGVWWTWSSFKNDS